MADFPGELIDSIIDHLRSDKSALLISGLVSTQWLSRSRYHGFSSIDLFIASCRNQGDWEGLNRVETFLSLVESPLATFVSSITEIRLSHRRDRIREKGGIISPKTILDRLDACGIRPVHLALHCLNHFMIPFSSPPAFASSVTHLDIQLTENHITLHSIVDYICAFPLLESLKIWGTPRTLTLEPSGEPLALPPQLHTMHAGHPLVTNWILTLDPVPKQLTKLIVLDRGWTRMNRHSAIEYIRGSLKLTGIEAGKHQPNLRCLQCLTHLIIKESLTSAPHFLLEILASLRLSASSATLETITVSLDFSETSNLSADWLAVDMNVTDLAAWPCLRSIVVTTGIDDVVASGKYSNLLRIHLAALSLEAEPRLPFAAALKQHLPRCDKRGMLSIIDIPVVEAIYTD
ncbi:hypothetical protein DFH06DRAFT_1299224 [Mycena polygramma]|nr:hypothetical protein DFH06DRAFT_1299224 [Mycena polygramma]